MNLSTYPPLPHLRPGLPQQPALLFPTLPLLRSGFHHLSYNASDTQLSSLNGPRNNKTKGKSPNCHLRHRCRPRGRCLILSVQLYCIHSVLVDAAATLACICPLNLLRPAHPWTLAAAVLPRKSFLECLVTWSACHPS